MYAAFLDLLAAYDNVQRPWLWDHLQNIGTPQHLLQTVMAMYRGGVYTLIDGDKISGEVAPEILYENRIWPSDMDIMRWLLMATRWV